MSENSGWKPGTGYGGVKEEEERRAASRGPRRFFLKRGERKQVVFVDDQPACIHEYNPNINGTWTNWFTSPRSDPNYSDIDSAMGTINKYLGNQYKDYYVGYYTVIDCSEWLDKSGNKHQYDVKLFPAKMKTLKLLQSRMEDFGGLAGKAINVRRTTDDKSPGTGEVFDLVKEVDMDKLWSHIMYQGKLVKDLFEEASEDDDARSRLTRIFSFSRGENGALAQTVPTFNYESLLRPKTPAELRSFFAGAQVEDPNGGSSSPATYGNSGVGDGGADEDVPF